MYIGMFASRKQLKASLLYRVALKTPSTILITKPLHRHLHNPQNNKETNQTKPNPKNPAPCSFIKLPSSPPNDPTNPHHPIINPLGEMIINPLGEMSSNPSSSASGHGGGGGGGGPCGACKFLRRKCIPGCVFAPYFDSEQGAAHFAAVHKVFGASNASKLLQNIPAHRRQEAVVAICYEAQARLRDPVYGCVAHIFALQQQVVNLQAELSYLQAHLGPLELPMQPPQPQLPMQLPVVPHSLSIADLPIPSVSPSMPAPYDVSSLFDPTAHPSSWAAGTLLRRTIDPRQFSGSSSLLTTMGEGDGDLRALTSELLSAQYPPRLPDASPSQCTSKKD
ncbi:LOW QUALITY PROTEIN: hypothetical protein BT93_D1346 [Corymbia citriodora subsp. variegata]|nr:LOW QUALITY PROTEIN: hypothetical protein BT93_D1346 [Corymbia citriodora subsp. variegata]